MNRVSDRMVKLDEDLGGGAINLVLLEDMVRDAIRELVSDYRRLGQLQAPVNAVTITEAVVKRLRSL